MLDTNLLLLNGASALSASADGAGVDMGPDLKAQTYMVHVPAVSGTTPTLAVKIQESDDNSAWRDFLAFPSINAVGQYFVSGRSNARYRRYSATLGGTTPNFGNTIIAPVPAGRHTNY